MHVRPFWKYLNIFLSDACKVAQNDAWYIFALLLSFVFVSDHQFITLVQCYKFMFWSIYLCEWFAFNVFKLRLGTPFTGGGGAHEVLKYRITVDFFANYRNTVIKFLWKYHHRSIFYQKLYFLVTVGWLKHRIPSIFYSNHRITAQKIGKYRIQSYRTPPV